MLLFRKVLHAGMDNAKEELKKVASFTITSVEDDGVVYAINKFFR